MLLVLCVARVYDAIPPTWTRDPCLDVSVFIRYILMHFAVWFITHSAAPAFIEEYWTFTRLSANLSNSEKELH